MAPIARPRPGRGAEPGRLAHRDELADHHQSGRGAEAVRDPEQVERRRPDHLAGGELVADRRRRGRCGPGRGSRRRGGRLVAGGRVAEQPRRGEGHHQEHRGRDLHRPLPAVGRDQHLAGEGAVDAGAGAVAADDQADGEPPAVGEPLRADRDRDRVAEAVAGARDRPESDVEPDERFRLAGQVEAERVEDAAEGGHPLRSVAVLQEAGDDEPGADGQDGDGEDHRHLGAVPAEVLAERRHEDAPGVDHAERQVHQHPAEQRLPTGRGRVSHAGAPLVSIPRRQRRRSPRSCSGRRRRRAPSPEAGGSTFYPPRSWSPCRRVPPGYSQVGARCWKDVMLSRHSPS